MDEGQCTSGYMVKESVLPSLCKFWLPVAPVGGWDLMIPSSIQGRMLMAQSYEGLEQVAAAALSYGHISHVLSIRKHFASPFPIL